MDDQMHIWNEHVQASDRIFEALVDKETEIEFSFRRMALALREEAWDHAFAISMLYDFAARFRDSENIQRGVVDRVNRARIVGLSHIFFWQAAPFEQDVRDFIANRIMEKAAACRAKSII